MRKFVYAIATVGILCLLAAGAAFAIRAKIAAALSNLNISETDIQLGLDGRIKINKAFNVASGPLSLHVDAAEAKLDLSSIFKTLTTPQVHFRDVRVAGAAANVGEHEWLPVFGLRGGLAVPLSKIDISWLELGSQVASVQHLDWGHPSWSITRLDVEQTPKGVRLEGETAAGSKFEGTSDWSKKANISWRGSELEFKLSTLDGHLFTATWKGGMPAHLKLAESFPADHLDLEVQSRSQRFSSDGGMAGIFNQVRYRGTATSRGRVFTFGPIPGNSSDTDAKAAAPWGYISTSSREIHNQPLIAHAKDGDELELRLAYVRIKALFPFDLDGGRAPDWESFRIPSRDGKWIPLIQAQSVPAEGAQGESKEIAAVASPKVPGTDKRILMAYKRTKKSFAAEKLSDLPSISSEVLYARSLGRIFCYEPFGILEKRSVCRPIPMPKVLIFNRGDAFRRDMQTLWHKAAPRSQTMPLYPWTDDPSAYSFRTYQPAISAMAWDNQRNRIIFGSWNVWASKNEPLPLWTYEPATGKFSMFESPFSSELLGLAYRAGEDKLYALVRGGNVPEVAILDPETFRLISKNPDPRLGSLILRGQDHSLKLLAFGDQIYVRQDDLSPAFLPLTADAAAPSNSSKLAAANFVPASDR